uniref:Serine hydrolase domain-containing protein n=1 Tax=Spongospora subterranea TaxID=70186 RepID=A0A0H5QIA0_9EUKA|eukprot:CRZ01347.1 hypothetical protein [Spongospora subterranea]
MRILCLHGFGQNASNFQGKTGGLRRVLKRFADLEYIQAPLQLTPSTADQTESSPGYTWWRFDAETKEYEGWKDSVAYIRNYIVNNGPFDGLFGFSQGASMLYVLCALQQQEVNSGQLAQPWHMKFGIFCGGFLPRDPAIPQLPQSQIIIPTLHIIGQSDETVPADKSEGLARMFADPDIYRHPAGHFIPTVVEAAEQYRQFMSKL